MRAETPAPVPSPHRLGLIPPGPCLLLRLEASAPIPAWVFGTLLGLGPSPDASGYLLTGLYERSHLDPGRRRAWPKVMGPRPSSGEASGYKWLTGGRRGTD